MFGRNQNKVDVPMLHDSISREHAAILLDQNKGALVIDLGSTSGTQLNGEKIQPNCAKELKNDQIQFGASTRLYKVTVDYSKYQKALQDKQRALQMEIHEMETLSDTKLADVRKKLGSNLNDTLYVGNLPYHFEQNEVNNLFRDCGDIVSIELKKGFAFVRMADQKGTRRVLNYDGHKVMGRALKISLKSSQQQKERERSRSRSPVPQRRRRRSPSEELAKRRRRYSSESESDRGHRHHHSRHQKRQRSPSKQSSNSSKLSKSSGFDSHSDK